MHDDIQNDNHDKADGEAADGIPAQLLDGIGEVIDHLAAGDKQSQAPENVLHTQGGHEGMGQVQAGQQGAVDEAHQAAGHNGYHHHQHAAGDFGLVHRAHDAGAEHGVGAHGEVNARGDEAEQHARRQEGVEGRLLQDAHEVAVAVEIGVCDGQDHAHDYQGQQGSHLEPGPALFLSHLNYLPKPLS